MSDLVIKGRLSDSLIRLGAEREEVKAWVGDRSRIFVTDENLLRLYGQFFEGEPLFVLSPGEVSKTTADLLRLLEAMARLGLDRRSCLVAVGGGVVSDLAVLAAGLYMRGIPCAVVSTSLLGQVDASVGGKCAVNFLGVKNLLGLFKQPDLIVCDTRMLSTLPEREWLGGLAEMVKHALLHGDAACDALLAYARAIRGRQPEVMAELITASVRFKADVVAQDEREAGQRQILNLGHTFGHVFEAEGRFNHGESISLGLVMALRYSRQIGMLDDAVFRRCMRLMEALELPLDPLEIPEETVRFRLGLDKKKDRQMLSLVLLRDCGVPVVHVLELEEVVRVWPALCINR